MDEASLASGQRDSDEQRARPAGPAMPCADPRLRVPVGVPCPAHCVSARCATFPCVPRVWLRFGRCVECPNVDLCEPCEVLSPHASMAHTVLRITRPSYPLPDTLHVRMAAP